MHLRTRVKICGITRSEDAIEAARLGVDALGMVFYAKSSRNINSTQAKAICRVLPGFVTPVALFLNPEESLVRQVLAEVDIDCLQFHGNESVEFCESFGKPYIKALGIEGVEDIEALFDQYSSARSVLLDSHGAGEAGGTGESFDWSTIPENLRQKIILAGGLKPDNVADAINQVRPYAVDLSSGVESAPGIKDSDLMMRLMKEVKRVDCG
ncbi:MAG: phosphoribosylanthranilate isomerase [endosymbiont of Galathealinum brachiosum]|uniref:N-(5'-phosphoribosyl)anthranilate isomerase n=1 Tax=endosymbiont of Galathealinum brachiosum TaxID=2200906 RepID=A0A370DIV1_9GAMM|nr:MAG: phosphoribosylanthranilate isomerase [endosymbiont of Galathealinum brachiosum]